MIFYIHLISFTLEIFESITRAVTIFCSGFINSFNTAELDLNVSMGV